MDNSDGSSALPGEPLGVCAGNAADPQGIGDCQVDSKSLSAASIVVSAFPPTMEGVSPFIAEGSPDTIPVPKEDKGVEIGVEGTKSADVTLIEAKSVPLSVEAGQNLVTTASQSIPMAVGKSSVIVSKGSPMNAEAGTPLNSEIGPTPGGSRVASKHSDGAGKAATPSSQEVDKAKHRAAILACMGPFSPQPPGNRYEQLQLLSPEEVRVT